MPRNNIKPSTRCTWCDGPRTDAKQSLCRACHTDYVRVWRRRRKVQMNTARKSMMDLK